MHSWIKRSRALRVGALCVLAMEAHVISDKVRGDAQRVGGSHAPHIKVTQLRKMDFNNY